LKLVVLILFFFISFIAFSQEELNSDVNPENTILFWNLEQKVSGFKNGYKFVPTRLINKSSNPLRLNNLLLDFSSVSYKLKNKTYTLDDYINKFNVGGLIVVRRGNVLYENYNLGNDKDSKWISFSVTKSVTSMLLGAAIQDGFIKNINEPIINYLPQLSGSQYDKVTIKNVLQMSSGVDWNEDYDDPYSDVNLAAGLNSLDLYEYLYKLERTTKPGKKFNYNTAESNLIGGLIREAVGSNLSSYLEKKIWEPFGMESDAYWGLDPTYQDELGGCCIYATLKDYVRIGMFALNQGMLRDGKQILPNKWIKDSTKPSRSMRYYGYQWWLDGPPFKSYRAIGIFGQLIWIDPQTKTVIAMQSAWDKAWTPEADQHRNAVLNAIMIKLYNL
tara:strand:- start:1628 stop:2791 length:1164 start_codon:yes stop_codon:yes gene_type:complete